MKNQKNKHPVVSSYQNETSNIIISDFNVECSTPSSSTMSIVTTNLLVTDINYEWLHRKNNVHGANNNNNNNNNQQGNMWKKGEDAMKDAAAVKN